MNGLNWPLTGPSRKHFLQHSRCLWNFGGISTADWKVQNTWWMDKVSTNMTTKQMELPKSLRKKQETGLRRLLESSRNNPGKIIERCYICPCCSQGTQQMGTPPIKINTPQNIIEKEEGNYIKKGNCPDLDTLSNSYKSPNEFYGRPKIRQLKPNRKRTCNCTGPTRQVKRTK